MPKHLTDASINRLINSALFPADEKSNCCSISFSWTTIRSAEFTFLVFSHFVLIHLISLNTFDPVRSFDFVDSRCLYPSAHTTLVRRLTLLAFDGSRYLLLTAYYFYSLAFTCFFIQSSLISLDFGRSVLFFFFDLIPLATLYFA